MTKTQQKKFVRELTATIRKEIEVLIDKGAIPDTWDGHELRCLLEDKFESAAQISTIVKNPKSQRAEDYQNTLWVNHL
jgi:hypothetical protein